MVIITSQRPVGGLVRQWREARRLSQLELSLRANVSARHLSFVETGRSRPSREMILHLAEELSVPARERNALLLAGGFAPVAQETAFDAPPLAPVRAAIRQILRGHEPYPAVVLNRFWDIVDANESLAVLTEGIPRELMATPVNVLRASLHPDGMAARTINLGEWRSHLLGRLRRQVELTGDPRLADLYDETSAFPGADPDGNVPAARSGDIAIPLRVRWRDNELTLISTVTTFGTPIDITVAELSIEAFYPANEETARILHGIHEARGRPSTSASQP